MKNKKPPLFKTHGILLALSMLLALPVAVLAADAYPSKPIRLIVPFPPGGGVDIIGRLLANGLSERLGKQVLLENRGGAGGIIGTEMVAKAAPDGYMLLFAPASYTIQPALQTLPYDPIKSFTPIAKLGSALHALVVHPSVPANSVKELIALAKQKPGQLIFVTSGSGSTSHMCTELLKMMADIDFKIVQFKGTGPAVIDLLGGHSHAMLSSLASMLPYIKSGKLRVLGTSGAKRSVILPDVPTIAETGIPGFETANWFGIHAPAGTPAVIVDRLNKEIKEIVALDETKKLFLNDGTEVDYLGPTEFGTFIAREINTWVRVAKKANIKVEE